MRFAFRYIVSFIILVFSLMNCDPNPGSKKKTAIDLETKARKAFNSGDFVFSIQCYDHLIKMDSLIGRYYYERGYLYAALPKGMEKAAKDFLKSAELNYRKEDSYNRVGACYAYVQDSVALIYFRKAFEINPGDSDNLRSYYKCLERLSSKNDSK